MLVSGAQELSPFSSSTLTFTSSCTFLSTFCSSNPFLSFPMRSSLSFLRSLSLSLSHHQPHHFHRHFFFRAISIPLSSSSPKTQKYFLRHAASSASSSHSTLVEHLACEPETNENWDFNNSSESEAAFDFDKNDGSLDLKHLPALALDVKEQWTRSKLAWLCKELPAHMVGTLVRILTAQRKSMRQADATYVAVHCMRIRESEAGFKLEILTKLRRSLIKAEEIFNQMLSDGAISVHTRSCNAILRGYPSSEEYVKAKKIYDLMCWKKYDFDSSLTEKLDYVMSLSRKEF